MSTLERTRAAYYGIRFTVAVLHHPFASLETERRILATVGASVIDAQVRTELEAIDACRDADAVLVRLFPLTRPVIAAMQRCRLICNYGAGYDNVDVRAAAERGIPVSATAGYGDDEVADHTLGLPNVIVTPHVAWYSEESIADRQRIAAETVRAALEAAL